MTSGSHTWQEIQSQPQTWAATLEAFADSRAALESFLAGLEVGHIAVAGCGSTYYLAQSAAATLTHCSGLPARAYPSSEVWLFPRAIPPGPALLLAISRSGTTTETLLAAERFRAGGVPVLAICCYPDSPLARGADLALLAPAAQEQSVVQTRSFTSMLLLTQAVAAILAHDGDRLARLQRLPRALEELTGRLWGLPWQLGADLQIERFFFLGGGPLYGLANEAALKTKEMSLSQAEAYHPLEFRHGPMSVVDERTLVVGLLSDRGLAEELRLLKEMQRLGARVLILIEDAPALGWHPDHVVELQSGLDEWERGPLYLPVLQRMAHDRARAKGLDPDRPHNLAAVVEL